MLWFPVMLNNHQIGTVKITREEGFANRGDTYQYRWEVKHLDNTDLTGTDMKHDHLHGFLTHRYSDGCYVLMQKVLAAYGRASKKAKV